MTTPEFSHVVRMDQIARLPAENHVQANAAERAALARRFGLIALDMLEADFALGLENGVLMARGRLRAALAQPCVATGEPVPEKIDAPFAIRFLKEGNVPEDEEMELSEEDCDTIFFDGESVDMGEAVAETAALAMAPYPRAPNADRYLKKMGVISEEQASPFAALLALKEQSEGKPE